MENLEDNKVYGSPQPNFTVVEDTTTAAKTEKNLLAGARFVGVSYPHIVKAPRKVKNKGKKASAGLCEEAKLVSSSESEEEKPAEITISKKDQIKLLRGK